jgi:tetratricopeptide (TPR) repeat protein
MKEPHRGSWLLPAGFALAGALAGLLVSLLGASAPFFQEPAGQELPYAATARNLASPQPVEPTTSVTAPLYPRLLSQFGGFETDFTAARRMQLLLLGALVPFLTVLAARRHFGARAGFVAGLLTLLLGGFWVRAATFVPYAWQAVTVLVMLLLLPTERGRHGASEASAAGSGAAGDGRSHAPGLVALFGVGIAAGVARLLGAAWAPAFVLVLAVLALVRKWGVAAAGGVVAAFVAVVLVGSALRLDPVAGSPPLLFGGGLESVLSWHDGARGVDPRRGERAPWRWMTGRDVHLEFERAENARLSTDETSRRGYARTMGWIASNPVPAGGLALRKAALFLSGAEYASPDSPRFRAQALLPGRGVLLWLSIPIFALGLAGLAAAGREGRTARALLLALAVGSVLAAVGAVARPGDRLALLLALTGPAAWALLHFGRLGARGITLLALGLGLGVWAAVLEAPKFESEAENRFQTATVYERKRRVQEAAAEYDRALIADPGHVPSQLARAGSLARDGVFDAAISTVEDVVARAPHISSAWNLLARLYQNQKRYAEAASAYERLVEIDPNNFEAWNNLGTMHVTLGRYEPAVAALRRALEIEPNYRSAFVNLAEVEKRGPEGLAGAEPVTPGAGSANEQLQQGVAAVMQRIQANDVEGAERLIAQLHETFAGSPYIDFASGTLALHKQEFQKALDLYNRARSGLPEDAALIFNTGVAHASLGQNAEAIAAMREVLRLDPTNEPARQMLQQLGAGGN